MQVDSNEMKSLLILRILFENEGKSFESRFISIQIRAYPDDIHDLAFPDLVTRKWTIKRVPLNCLYTISAEIYIYIWNVVTYSNYMYIRMHTGVNQLLKRAA